MKFITALSTRKVLVLASVGVIVFSCTGYYVYRTQYLPSKLRIAATSGDLDAVQEILKKDVDVNRTLGAPSNSVLNRAIEGGNPSVVEAVLQAGADANALGETGWSPLMVAAFSGNSSIIKSLVRHGAQVGLVEPRHRNTALLIAIRKGHTEAVRVLIAAGADPNQSIELGDAPLCRAQSIGRSDIASILRQAGGKCER